MPFHLVRKVEGSAPIAGSAAAVSIPFHNSSVSCLFGPDARGDHRPLSGRTRSCPLLKKRYPNASEARSPKSARVRVWRIAGAVTWATTLSATNISATFCTHVRSGDFVVIMIQESTDLNEYAFALGAPSHYAADNTGHPVINRVVTHRISETRKKFGVKAPPITTIQKPTSDRIRLRHGAGREEPLHLRPLP